ncbi:MAG: 50S ribosomal protein L21 [Gammaproteobacteria bacterium CG11_big_fil_rev_8_21_14_0_20_46_22]|nr:MAG: 50S ribosomal protein L21 [Gammaproteobacteria bacterium CG12_big_fil_rev_8_21_14_0_65_46_12]PIR11601.1 MAG: 50S ribosomal protein L21 [Gammaproteobacteria bacterium CG11_big_fil_rev_8_21_14_0_20_46_22]
MYAVIETGGKQYKVAQGQRLKVEKLDLEAGNTVEFNKVMLLADGVNITLGQPFVEGAMVEADVVSHGRHRKIKILKFKRRKHHMKRQGHRQGYTEIEIKAIKA